MGRLGGGLVCGLGWVGLGRVSRRLGWSCMASGTHKVNS